MVAGLAAIAVFAMGGSALATTGRNGPTVPQLGDPVTTINEVQAVTLTGNPTGGTFTLTLGGDTTGAIAYSSTASNSANGTAATNALVALPGVGAGNASAAFLATTSGPVYKVTFAATLGDLPTMSGSGAGLTGGTSPGVSVVSYADGGSVTGQVAPHGGYSSSTDYCLQCHQVHDGGEYALLTEASVTSTCQTCHAYFGSTGIRVDPGFPGAEGTTSMRSVYDVSTTPRAEHQMGATSIPASTLTMLTQSGWNYGGFNPTTWDSADPAGPGTSSDVSGGLYCGDCHTPHGDAGQLVNTKYYRSTAPAGSPSDLSAVQNWVEGGAIYVGRNARVLHWDTDPAVWEACTTIGAAVAGGPDTGCAYLTTADSEGQTVYTYGYKMLSAYPNHSWAQGPESWATLRSSKSRTGISWSSIRAAAAGVCEGRAK